MRVFLSLMIVSCFLRAQGADKYTDGNRPYEFGFTIDGEQHRHEKKDEKGIIMGEFGFITADGVYHVTVYATDEEGHFKIISMKNIRVKPYPTAPELKNNPSAISLQQPQQAPELKNNPSAISLQQPQHSVTTTPKPLLPEITPPPPGRQELSCSHCSLPAPKVPPTSIASSKSQLGTIGTQSSALGSNNQLPTGSTKQYPSGQQISLQNRNSFPEVDDAGNIATTNIASPQQGSQQGLASSPNYDNHNSNVNQNNPVRGGYNDGRNPSSGDSSSNSAYIHSNEKIYNNPVEKNNNNIGNNNYFGTVAKTEHSDPGAGASAGQNSPVLRPLTNQNYPVPGIKLKQNSPGSAALINRKYPESETKVGQNSSGYEALINQNYPGSRTQVGQNYPESGTQVSQNSPGSGAIINQSYPGSRTQVGQNSPISGTLTNQNYPESGTQESQNSPSSGALINQNYPGSRTQVDQNSPVPVSLTNKNYPKSGTQKSQNSPGSETITNQNYPESVTKVGGNYPNSGTLTDQNYPELGSRQSQNNPGTKNPSNQNYPISVNSAGKYYPEQELSLGQNYPAQAYNSVSNNPFSENNSPPRENDANLQNVSANPHSFGATGTRERNPKQYRPKQETVSTSVEQPVNPQNSQRASTSPSTRPGQKPTLISAQMRIVDKNTDVHKKKQGENDGLPDGLNQNDMMRILYTFNYTVGFHGHHEEGYSNGAKIGYYYVTGRNGVRTRVDYEADENGFRPKVTQEILDILSDEVPKPETEKEEKFGLKSYEFKWLYFPVESKS